VQASNAVSKSTRNYCENFTTENKVGLRDCSPTELLVYHVKIRFLKLDWKPGKNKPDKSKMDKPNPA